MYILSHVRISHVRIYMYMYMHVNMYIHICIYVYMYMYTYICTYYVHVYVYMYMSKPDLSAENKSYLFLLQKKIVQKKKDTDRSAEIRKGHAD